jgi:hypothetical protein
MLSVQMPGGSACIAVYGAPPEMGAASPAHPIDQETSLAHAPLLAEISEATNGWSGGDAGGEGITGGNGRAAGGDGDVGGDGGCEGSHGGDGGIEWAMTTVAVPE